MTASAIRAWAIKGPEGNPISLGLSAVQAWKGAMDATGRMFAQHLADEGFTCIEVEIREHPAQDAALLLKMAAFLQSAKVMLPKESNGRIVADDLCAEIKAHLANTEQK